MAAHDGKGGCNLAEYTTDFLLFDWPYFLWHGANRQINLSIYLSIYLYICIYIETILSSLQACSVITHSSGDFIRRIKSPDELVITKQACRDESIVSLFFSPVAIYIYIYM